MSEHSVRRAHE